MQEVLFWQTCTLRMMFKIVGDALAEVGRPDKHPGDYLIFLTVGMPPLPPACVHRRRVRSPRWVALASEEVSPPASSSLARSSCHRPDQAAASDAWQPPRF